MWRLRRSVEGEYIVLRLSGRIEGEELVELKEFFASESGVRNTILDLEEVKLVDQDAVTFLADCEAGGTQLRNCPAYIREWMARDQRNSAVRR
jgi:ABC-type transporter Mla MlaB component